MNRLELQNRDSLELLKNTHPKSVALILTDPPYAISKPSGMQTAIDAGEIKQHAGGSIARTDFGDWDHDFGLAELEPHVAEWFRVLRDGGSCLVWYDFWKLSDLARLLRAAGFSKLRLVQWVKTNPVPVNQSATYLSNAIEFGISCVKGGAATFNSKYDNGIYEYPIYQDPIFGRCHPTQKSLDLFRELIKKHSNPGDLVFDGFSGSGTTALACLLEDRRFIGAELDQEHWQASQDRLAAWIAKPGESRPLPYRSKQVRDTEEDLITDLFGPT